MGRNDNIFNVHIKRLALLTLPTWLRRPLCAALIYAGVTPLGRALNDLRSFRSATSYRLGHNGQVCRLRGVLNDEFDPKLRRITVDDGESVGRVSAREVWMREEGRWLMVPDRAEGSLRLHRRGFGMTGGYDFWVSVPADLRDERTETRLRAMVNMYKLASKRYAVIYK